ncbi:MAG: hypothetical protein ACE5OO_05145, partial [Candidatus Bathyarchaeia archaeon]
AVVDEESRRRLVFRDLLLDFSDGDPHIWTRYLVYRDLRSRGFVVREEADPGVDFHVYERGSYGKRPPAYLVHAVWEGEAESIDHLRRVLEAAEACSSSPLWTGGGRSSTTPCRRWSWRSWGVEAHQPMSPRLPRGDPNIPVPPFRWPRSTASIKPLCPLRNNFPR